MNYKAVANNLKFLAVDMINQASSGHPGVAMGLADALAVLASKLNYNPNDANWANRDRLIFSGGHASSLIYSFLHLAGYKLSLDELKNFRQLHSRTSGHPEIAVPGVEIDTGPLGQGIANAVGFAMAAKFAARSCSALNHKVFCFCGDGDLQEGISYEALSLANVHNLDNLVLLYDSNGISIEGDVKNAFKDDIHARFSSCGFKVYECDGHDHAAISKALDLAIASAPAIVVLKTAIGKGALELEGTASVHGAPLGAELAIKAKEAVNYPTEPFYVDSSVLEDFKAIAKKGEQAQLTWEESLNQSDKDFLKSLDNKCAFSPDFSSLDLSKSVATRASNHSCLQEVAKACKTFLGGSADLAPSNKTDLKGEELSQNGGRNIAFGIREHAMGAICNAFARYGYVPFCATFMVFSDYLKPAIRLAALMRLREFFIFTHDSIGVGEDGPTHQPIEQLSTLRAMPNLLTLRPADTAENAACWQLALAHNGPSAFILSRSNLAAIHTSLPDLSCGAVVIKDAKNAQISLLASGSEVALALKTAEILEGCNISTKVISMPCYELFIANKSAQNELLEGKVIAIEAANSKELYEIASEVYGIDTFGLSGKEADVFKHFKFTPEDLSEFCKKALL